MSSAAGDDSGWPRPGDVMSSIAGSMLDRVTPDLRGVAYLLDGGELRVRFLYAGRPDEWTLEEVSFAETECIADFWPALQVEYVAEHLPADRPRKLGAGEHWVYLRKESSAGDSYRDTQLVELYDVDNPGGEDHAYYRALADELGARTIVDLGCGTGLLTRSLVQAGRAVYGVDPSWAMLQYARRQPGAEQVTWIDGDARAIAPGLEADLAICTSNAIMHLELEQLRPAFSRLAATLRGGGTLSFETRNPAYREWERWNREATYGERDTPFGHLKEWLEVTEVDERERGRVVFDAHNVFADGEERVYTSTLFFREADVFRHELELAGFADIDVRGDWHGSPVGDSSRLLIFRTRHQDQAIR
ncbi:class I SAM-dependent methyltransferase [Flindersiella endophytica]